MGGKITKKILKITLLVLAIIIAVDLIVVALLFVPPIQQKVVNVVTSTLSKKWNSEVSVDRIYLSPTLKLHAEHLIICDHHQQPMIAVGAVNSRLQSLKLNPISLALSDVEMDSVRVIVKKYTGDSIVNISIWASHFPKKDSPSGFTLSAPAVRLQHAYFAYINESEVRSWQPDSIDYAFFELQNLEIGLRDFKLKGADITAHFDRLSFDQYTGFRLLNLTGDFKIGADGLSLHNAAMLTPTSQLFMDFAFDYDSWKDYGNFLDSIRFVVDISPSTFNTHDLTYFAPQLRGMDNELLLAAQIEGPINHLNVANLKVKFSDTTSLSGHMLLDHIPDFFHAHIAMHLDECCVDMRELSTFALPGAKNVPIPDNLKKMRPAHCRIDYDGVLSDSLSASLTLNTLKEQLEVKLETNTLDDANVNYNLSLDTRGFNVGYYFPQLASIGQLSLEAEAAGQVNMRQFISSLQSDVHLHLKHIYLKNYPLKNLVLHGNYADQGGNAHLVVSDDNLALTAHAHLDNQHEEQSYRVHASIEQFSPNKMFANLPPVDSLSSDPFDRFVRYLQRNSDVTLAVKEISCDLHGPTLMSSQGNLFIDDILYTQNGKALPVDRLRLTLFDQGDNQKYFLSSDFLSASLSTNCPIHELPSTCIDFAYAYFANLLPERAPSTMKNLDTLYRSIDFNLSVYQLNPVFQMFLPSLTLAEGTRCSLRATSLHSDDLITLSIPHLSYNQIQVQSVDLALNQDSLSDLQLRLDASNLRLGANDNFLFAKVGLDASLLADSIAYALSWDNPLILSDSSSFLQGMLRFPSRSYFETHMLNSAIYVKDQCYRFNKDHLLAIQRGNLRFQNLLLKSDSSFVMLDGTLMRDNDSLVLSLSNVDLDLVNSFMNAATLSFGGLFSANLQLRSLRFKDDEPLQRVLLGAVLIKDFTFNQADFGNLYAVAAVPQSAVVSFTGGLISNIYFPENATLDNYRMSDFRQQKGVNTKLNGNFDLMHSELLVTADIDTLPLNFLEPFLASFSHKMRGNASGKINFVLNSDSLYFDGKAFVREADLGIAVLNTVYNMKGQTIEFNREGFSFNQVVLTDKFGNPAELNGYIHHQKFNDFALDLKIKTPKLLVLNRVQKPDFPFYGDAYVSGNVAIYGDMSKLHFVGHDLRTEAGTRFCLPISFADKVSESNVITFKLPEPTTPIEEDTIPILRPSEMAMEFDFTLDVSPVADILLDMDLSAFGGSIATKGSGKVHFNYDTQSDINMLGNVVLESGSFMMRFAQLLNRKFYLMPGGTVNFGGSLDDININVKAMYSTTASLADLFTTENTNIRRVPVKTYLQFNGNLSDPAAIDFSFELPNATSDFNNLFYSTIDTTNVQKKTEQFFSLVMLGKFVSPTPNAALNASSIEQTGIGLLTSTLSDMISQQLKYVDLRFNYQNANEAANRATEYSVSASTSLFNDRTIIEGYFGYVDDQNQSMANQSQFIGDFSIEQKLNQAGTWSVKVFNVTNQDELRNATRNSPYAQGVALIYKQDFNNRKDLMDSFKRSKQRKNRKKKSHEQ